jgi:3-oxoacyl-[acyl-carrier-protein] synthase-3
MRIFFPATGVRIAATGSYLPPRAVSTAELASRAGVPLDADEILRLTGVRSRHFAQGESTSDLAIAAGRVILGRAGAPPETVERLLLTTTTPDYQSPPSACAVQHRLGLAHVPSFDMAGACNGFLLALDTGVRAVLTGDRRVLVIAADVNSSILDLEDRATCAIFGDGAAGVLLEPGPEGQGVLALCNQTDGVGYEAVHVPGGGSRHPASPSTLSARMHAIRIANGPELMILGVQKMSEIAHAVLDAARVRIDDVDLIVPHQANGNFAKRFARYLKVPLERIYNHGELVGNTSSASVPLALDAALSAGRVRPGGLVLLVAGGAGFSTGACLIRVEGG